MNDDTSIPAPSPLSDPRAVMAGGVLVVIVCALWSATIGAAPAAGAIAAFVQVAVPSLALALCWLAGAAGIGRLLSGLWRRPGTGPDWLLQVTAGAAVCLFLAVRAVESRRWS